MSAPIPSRMQRARRVAIAAFRQGTALRLPQAAASLAFLSLLALVPVFTIAVSLLGALPMFSKLRDALLKFLAANLFLPSFSETLVRYLNQFAAKASQLSLIGALLFFASAFSALLTIDHTLNRIWHVERARPLARRLTIYWTFLTLGPLLLAGSVTINGVIASEFLGGARLAVVERLWLDVLPWIITIGGLTLLYRLVPNAPVMWRDAFAGALAAAVLLEVLKHVLGVQVARLPTYTVVYGTFAALPMFLVWLFLVWMMVLAGALVSANLPYWDAADHEPRPAGPARRFDSVIATPQGQEQPSQPGPRRSVGRESHKGVSVQLFCLFAGSRAEQQSSEHVSRGCPLWVLVHGLPQPRRGLGRPSIRQQDPAQLRDSVGRGP